MASTSGKPVLIATLTAAPLDVSLVEPFRISLGTMRSVRNALVTLMLDDGTEGIGEAAPFPELTGETQGTVMAALAGMASLLEGADATDYRKVHAKLLSAFRQQPSARAAVETALFDALGRRAGMPLHRFFGGSGTTVSTDLTIPIVDAKRAAVRAKEIRRLRISVIKTKVGHDVADDLKRIEAIRKAYPEAGLILDANQGFTPKEALAFIQRLTSAKIHPLMIEQPVHRLDLAGMAFVRQRCPYPVFADESVFTAADALRVASEGAADGINIKLAKCGGLVEAMDIAAVARASGLGLMIGAMLETRLGLTASAHFAAGTGGFRFVDLDTHMLLASDPFEGGFRQNGAELALGDEPGLGIRLREESPPAAR